MTDFRELPRYGVLSIDPSLTGMGVLYCADGSDHAYKEFASKPAKTLESRIKRYSTLADNVLEIIKITIPKLCLIEGYAFGAKGASVVTLGEFGGVLRYKLVGIADLTVEVPPTVLKKFVTGKGNAKKLDVVSALSSKYRIVFSSDNHADAFGLSRLGLAALDLLETKNKHEREAVSVVKGLIEREES